MFQVSINTCKIVRYHINLSENYSSDQNKNIKKFLNNMYGMI